MRGDCLQRHSPVGNDGNVPDPLHEGSSEDAGTTHDATATEWSSGSVPYHLPAPRNKKSAAGNGYAADASSNSRSHNDNISITYNAGGISATSGRLSPDSKLGWVIDVAKPERRSHRSLRRRHKLRKPRTDAPVNPLAATRLSLGLSLGKPAPSPIHPDIDISLTRHVTTSDLMVDSEIVSSAIDTSRRPRSVSSMMAIDALSSFVLSCLAGSTAEADPPASRGAAIAPEFAASKSESGRSEPIVAKVPEAATAVFASSTALEETQSRKRKQSSNMPQHGTRKEMALSPGLPGTAFPSSKERFPQVISDVASFSTYHYTLEDALELADTPRLLLEAAPPHRVIHANAAFSTDILLIGRSSGSNRRKKKRPSSRRSVQDWMEERNTPYHPHLATINRSRSLEKAIEDVIPDNVNIPFTCYPVLGAGQITHYLLEAAATNRRAAPPSPLNINPNGAVTGQHRSGSSSAVDVRKDENRQKANDAFDDVMPSQAIG